MVTDIAATATSPITIHSSLNLIDASATTGAGVYLCRCHKYEQCWHILERGIKTSTPTSRSPMTNSRSRAGQATELHRQ